MLNPTLLADLAGNRYVHINNLIDLFPISEREMAQFKLYWNNLVLDENFKNYTNRKRRILRYHYQPGQPLRLNRDASYQPSATYSVDYTRGVNNLTYVEEDFITHPVMQHILATDIALLQYQLDASYYYAIDAHQFRVSAEQGNVSPTTSGIHQDGTDWVCMHFIAGSNIYPVLSEVHISQQEAPPLLATTMNQCLETLIIDDKHLYHRAGSVRQLSASAPAFRDILVITFRKCSQPQAAVASPCQ